MTIFEFLLLAQFFCVCLSIYGVGVEIRKLRASLDKVRTELELME